MSSPIIAKGFKALAAVKRNTNAWGGAAVACGAGNGIQLETHSLAPAVELIQNDAVSGKATRLPGNKGNELHSGDIGPMPFYYRGLELLLALVGGTAGTPATIETGAYRHTIKINDSDAGKHLTFVEDPFGDSTAPIHEWPCVKLTGMTMEWESGKQGKLTFNAVAFTQNYNTGSPITNRIVTSTTPANGTLTIANQPATPSPLTITVTDANASITEFVVTIVGTNLDGDQITEVYTLSVNGLTWTSTNYFASVTSVTGSGLAGTAAGDTIVVGVSNGVNNATSIANVTLQSEQDFVLFSQITSALFNDQAGAALTAATSSADNDEYYISGLRVQVSLGGNYEDITTKFGNKVEEPVRAGSEFISVTLGINFSKLDSRNHQFLKRNLNKTRQKGKITFSGPIVGSTVTPHSLTLYFNNLTVNSGAPTLTGPGVRPFDVEMMAYRALTTPSGFTSGHTDPLIIELVNSLSTDPLA